MRLLVGIMLLGLGCATTQGPVVPVIKEGTLDSAHSTQQEGVSALKRSLPQPLVAGECDQVAQHFGTEGKDFLAWCKALPPETVLKLGVNVEYGLGNGLVGLVRAEGGGQFFQAKRPAHLSATASGFSLEYDSQKWLGEGYELARVDATVRLYPEHEWLEADTTLVFALPVETAIVPVHLVARSHGGEGGLRIEEVSSAGQPVPFRVLEDQALVLLKATRNTPIRLKYSGEVRQHSGSWVSSSEGIVLRGEDGWLPTMARYSPVPTDYTVRVEAPADYALFGQGGDVPGNVRGAGGRIRADDFTLYGGKDYVTRSQQAGGTTLICAVPRQNEASLARTCQDSTTILQRYSEFLGPYPQPMLRVVESGFPGGYGALSNITLGAGGFASADLPFVAHEIAHGWFGGKVSCNATGAVVETLAEYVSSLVMEPSAREHQRAEWLEKARQVPAEKDFAVSSSMGLASGSRPFEYVVTYDKGPWALALFERQFGQRCVERGLRALLEGNKAKACWPEVVEALGASCGQTSGAVLQQLLDTTHALPNGP